MSLSHFFFIFYTLIYLGLLAWAARLWIRRRSWGIFWSGFVLFGVFYDNLILSLGNAIGPGAWLETLSWPRFILHQLVLPGLIYTAWDQADRAGVAWAAGPGARRAAVAGCVLTAVLGVVTRLLPMRLEIAFLDGVTRYVAAGVKGPPLVSVLSIGFCAVVGVFLWRRRGWPWTALAALLVFVGEGLPLEALRRLVGSGLEVVFMLVLLLYEQKLSRTERF